MSEDVSGKEPAKEFRDSGLWVERWARFSSGLLQNGLGAEKHEFAKGWVRRFFSFIKPGKCDQATREDVEAFLKQLVKEDKLDGSWIKPTWPWNFFIGMFCP